ELRSEVGRRYHIENIVGRSARMQAVFKTVLTVAPLKTTVLITGESGTGKELIAKAIHYQSPRARRPLVTLNCAAIPETLLESELFGHEKGSFTDALTRNHWPGNVRELENLMERLLVLSEGPTIGIEELPDQVRRSEQDPGTIREQVLQGRKSLGDAVDEFERDIIVEALGQTDFN